MPITFNSDFIQTVDLTEDPDTPIIRRPPQRRSSLVPMGRRTGGNPMFVSSRWLKRQFPRGDIN